jgi:glycosyltransferase involved in cell wall biosynthesis
MPSSDTNSSSVAILLGFLDGSRFLPAQLASFERQTHKNWLVVASDDGSTDESATILAAFREKWGPRSLTVHKGPSKGFAINFLSLIARPEAAAPYYAFSDQDDVWEDDKLARALAWLSEAPAGTPALYGSRTSLIDEGGRLIGKSPLFRKPPEFANALVQNIAGGNTMVFNEAARQLIIKAGGALDVPSHDWWLYLLTTAAGGLVRYDPYCSVQYRQHEDNLVGWNIGTVARARRVRMLIQGRFKRWTDQNILALSGFRSHMSNDSRATFDAFCKARERDLAGRVGGVWRSGVYRQTVFGSIGLMIGVALNKI